MNIQLKTTDFSQILTELRNLEKILNSIKLRVDALAGSIEHAPDIMIQQPSARGAQAGGLRKIKEELAAVISCTIKETSALNWFFIVMFSILTAFGIYVVTGIDVNAITGGGTGASMAIQMLLAFIFSVPLYVITFIINLCLLILSAAKERKYSFTGRSFVTIVGINGGLAGFTYLPVANVSTIPAFVGVSIVALGGAVAFAKAVYCLSRKTDTVNLDTGKLKELKLKRRLRLIIDIILMPFMFAFAIYFTGAYHVALLGLAAFGIGAGIGAVNSIAYAKGSTSTGGTDTCANILASKFGGHPMLWMRGIDVAILLLGALVAFIAGNALSGLERFINSCLLVVIYGVYAESVKDLLVKLQQRFSK